MTVTSLRALTRKSLAARAKKHQIAGWHDMTKDELVLALAAYFRRRRGRDVPSTQGNGKPTLVVQSAARPNPRAAASLGGNHLGGRRLLKPMPGATAPAAVGDTLVATARGPCWVHVSWTLSRNTLNRAEAAMGTQWHQAVPLLRVFDVSSDDAGASVQRRIRDVEIHGDVDHWYLPLDNAPRTYKVQIGYRAPSGAFFVMAQSNRVQTPRPGSHSLRARRGAEEFASGLDLEKKPSYDLKALPTSKQWNAAAAAPASAAARGEGEPVPPPPVELKLHAELIVHGTTDPHAELSILGKRVPVSRDGAFSHRFSLPDGRHVIDATVTTRNGCHQRTVVLGVERNTKELEPQWFDEIHP